MPDLNLRLSVIANTTDAQRALSALSNSAEVLADSARKSMTKMADSTTKAEKAFGEMGREAGDALEAIASESKSAERAVDELADSADAATSALKRDMSALASGAAAAEKSLANMASHAGSGMETMANHANQARNALVGLSASTSAATNAAQHGMVSMASSVNGTAASLLSFANIVRLGLSMIPLYATNATNDLLALEREINAVTNAVNVSAAALQVWAAGAKKVGLEADNIGDIFKDVSDKLGDLATTGGGEAKDLFDQLNLKIKDFVGLKPDQALLKIGQALDKSGLTKSQKIFLLEGLADDASKLLPLLENNAQKLKDVNALAMKAGALLSKSDLETLNKANAKLADIQLAADGLKNKVGLLGAEFLRAVGDDVVNALIKARENVNDLAFEAGYVHGVWSREFAALVNDLDKTFGTDTKKIVERFGHDATGIIELTLESLRVGFEYAPITVRASMEAAFGYIETFGYRFDAKNQQLKALWDNLFFVIVKIAGTAMADVANVTGDATAAIIGKVADAAAVMGEFSAAAAETATRLRQMQTAASGAGEAAQQGVDTLAQGYRDAAIAAENAAKLSEAQAQASAANAQYTLAAAAAKVKENEEQRKTNKAYFESQDALNQIGASYDVAGAATAHFDDSVKLGKGALEEQNKVLQKHQDTLKQYIESLTEQRIALEEGDGAAKYYTARLAGLSEAEAKASASAEQYNSYLSLRKSLLQEAANQSDDEQAKFVLRMQDAGLIGLDDAISRIKGVTSAAVDEAQKYQSALEAIGQSAASMGNSVATAVATSSANIGKSAQGFESYIKAASAAKGIDANFLRAILQQETGFLKTEDRRARAVSPVGALGVGQVMPATGAQMGYSRQDLFDPAKNIMASATYLRQMLDRFGGNERLAAAAYNAGPNRQSLAAGQIPNIPETQKYVANVTAYAAEYRKHTEAATVATQKAVPVWETLQTSTQVNQQAVADTVSQVAIYGGKISELTVTEEKRKSLLNEHLDIVRDGLLKTAEDRLQTEQLTGAELRHQQLTDMNIGQARAQQVYQAEQLANYTAEKNKLEQDGFNAVNGLAAQYSKELLKQNISQRQIADLVGQKMAGETQKVLHNAELHRQELLLTPAAYQAMQLASDGFSQAQIAQIAHANELNKSLENIRKTADQIGEDLLNAFTAAALGGENAFDSLIDTLKNSFTELVLKPTISPITAAVSAGVNGTLSGQSNPWMPLLSTAKNTWAGMGAGGWQGAATSAGVMSTLAGAVGGNSGGAAIGSALGSMTPLGPLGGIIGGVIGGLLGGSKGKPQAMFTADRGGTAWEAVGVSATSKFGKFGFSDAGTKNLSAEAEANLAKVVQSIAAIDNAFAAFLPATEVERIKSELATYSKSTTDMAALLKDRVTILSSGLSVTMRGLLDYSQDADGLINQINALIVIQREAIPALQQMNLQLGGTADTALLAANNLVDAAGSLSNLTSAAAAYYDAVYSDDEQKQIAIKNAQAAVNAFNQANGAQIDSLTALRKYVEGLDLTVAANDDAAYAAMSLVDELQLLANASSTAGNAVTNAADQLLEAANSAYDEQQSILSMFSGQFGGLVDNLNQQLSDLEKSYADQIAAYQKAINIAGSLRDALISLQAGDLTNMVPVKQLEAARIEFDKLKKAAEGGDLDAAARLQNAGEILLRLSREYNASGGTADGGSYNSDFNNVTTAWGEIQKLLEEQKDPQDQLVVAQNKLIDAAKEQMSGLAKIYGGIVGGNTVLTNLSGLMGSLPVDISTALSAILKNLTPPTPKYTPQQDAARAVSAAQKYTDQTSQIISLYQTLLNRPVDQAGLAYWLQDLKNGATLAQIAQSIINSSEYKNSHATGLAKVPYDGYKAVLHKDEAVIDAATMSSLKRYGIPVAMPAAAAQAGHGEVDISALLTEIRALRAEVAALRKETAESNSEANSLRAAQVRQLQANDRSVSRAITMRGG